MSDAEDLLVQAERVRAANLLGRSDVLQRLFDFLLNQSLLGRAPKEVEVAVEVFGKSPEDVAHSAVVRVYVHKLRRKLADFYAHESTRLTMPKGEYRLVLERTPQTPDRDSAALPGKHMPRVAKWLVASLCVSLVANALMFFVGRYSAPAAYTELRPVQQSAIWSPLFDDERPIFVVVGDYFIFGETDDTMEIRRLVREFNVNTQRDLEDLQRRDPDAAERYTNLDLRYLPTAAAFALRDLMPVLALNRNGSRRVRVVLMSDLTPAILKSAHIVYIGYLSGLGMMQNTVFSGSRLSIGETYDELIDRQTHRTYISQAATAHSGGQKFRDYGYFSSFRGPTGNQIMIIAGTRDIAVMQMSEALTRKAGLEELAHKAGGMQAFEALYEAEGMDRFNLSGRMIFIAPLKTSNIWASSVFGVGPP